MNQDDFAAAVNVGTENTSLRQIHQLQDHRNGELRRPLFSVLNDLATDPDILEGIESLHPDWIEIFNNERHDERHDPRALRRFVPRGMVEHVERFFGSLQYTDRLIATINPQDESIAFLLGAGASKPEPSGIPTVSELLEQLLERARRLDREQMTALADFCDERNIANIEDLLTAVQISAFCSRNPTILSLVEFQLFGSQNIRRSPAFNQRSRMRTDVSSVAYVQDTLQLLFGLLSNLMLPSNPNACHQAIVDYLDDKRDTTIVTTNYDFCMDRSLIDNEVRFSYTIDFTNPHVMRTPKGQEIQLIKLHGSLNWFYCETCQAVSLIDIEQAVKNYEKERGEYAIVSVCKNCGGQRRGLLVPPHAMKFDAAPPLQPLIANATNAFSDKSLIVVVGFSFSDADIYISRMLIKAMQDSPSTRILIVDPDSNVIGRIRSKFVNQIPDFDGRSRVLGLQGDCADILPKFLRGEIMTPKEEAPSMQAVAG